MDANGTRFHLLLGRDDWGRCTAGGVPLAAGWDASPPDPAGMQVEWDDKRDTLTLARRAPRFIAAKGDVPPSQDSRRGAARDAFGNTYWIDETRQAIRVLSAGSGRASRFWPDDAPPARPSSGGFAPVAGTPKQPPTLAGLGVTDDHYLVVGTLAPAGLLVFDLHAVGEPAALLWPAGVDFAPFDMAPRPNGGVVVLDRTNRRIWTLDRGFAVVPSGDVVALTPRREDDFQPLSGEHRTVAARQFDGDAMFDPASPLRLGDVVAIETLGDGTVLLLEADDGGGFARLAAYRAGAPVGDPVSLEVFLDELEAEDRAGFRLVGYDMALLRDENDPSRATVFVASSEGNQCFAVTAEVSASGLALEPTPAFYPMRRFAGKGLAAGGGKVFYDFGQTWIPLVAQRLVRYARAAEIDTPPLDSGLPDCVWHRLMLDACIPSGADLTVQSRAAADEDLLAMADWQPEPGLYLRGNGSEIPWLDAPFTDPAGGTWELLFQNARGRHLQLRLTLSGNERASPRVARLRAWFPRFSYLEQYLPAIYRDDPAPASFLDRFLANFEGTETAIEDRIAAAQILLDVRSAPADSLEWLASWFGVALDPVWDERRRRLFIRHAATFFRWRGTAHGLRMALALALDPCLDEALLGEPGDARARPYDIRIIEQFMTRRYTPLALGDPLELAGPRAIAPTPGWTPAQGGAALHQRYADAIAAPGAVFPLVAPGDAAAAAKWQTFCATTLGFVPTAAGELRAAWQAYLVRKYVSADRLPADYAAGGADISQLDAPADMPSGAVRDDWRDFLARASARTLQALVWWQEFLARRYRRVRALNETYATHWDDFDAVSFPAHLPPDGARLADWHAFESTVEAMHRAAHRFSVLVPTPRTRVDRAAVRTRLDLARRIVALEKPAHTVFNVGLYWALFRVGEARLGLDTLLEAGSRAPDLLPPVVLGLDYVGEAHLDRTLPAGRQILECA